jgi:hypothetical protein
MGPDDRLRLAAPSGIDFGLERLYFKGSMETGKGPALAD